MAGLSRERAVSDVVAFSLVFAMVITVVSATFVLGMAGLEEYREGEQTNVAEHQMEAVASAFDDIHLRGSEARSIELELDRGTLDLTDSSVEVTAGGSTTAYSTNSLELQHQQAVIAYENGAVVRQTTDDTGGVVRHDPAFYCGSSRAVISVLQFPMAVGGDARQISVGGQDSIKLIGRLRSQTVEYSSTSPETVTIDVSGLENTESWSVYLSSDESGWSTTGSDTVFECTGVEVVVRLTKIDLETRS